MEGIEKKGGFEKAVDVVGFVAGTKHFGCGVLTQFGFQRLMDKIHLGRTRKNQPDSGPSTSQRGSQFLREYAIPAPPLLLT